MSFITGWPTEKEDVRERDQMEVAVSTVEAASQGKQTKVLGVTSPRHFLTDFQRWLTQGLLKKGRAVKSQ